MQLPFHRPPIFCHVLAALGWLLAVHTAAQAQPKGLLGSIDLMKKEGVDQVKGEWRFTLVTTGTGPDKNDIEPRAHDFLFDDSKWEVVAPETLGKARGPGKYSWSWYRLKVTIPEQINGKDTTGTSVWFQTIVDDYGEVYVDGKIDLAFGKSGRGAVTGFNTRNRVLVGKNVKPGQTHQIAILGINSPLGNPPGNFIFLRPTSLEFFAPDAPEGGADEPPVAAGPAGSQAAAINLMTAEGATLVKGEWRYHDVDVHTGSNKNELEPKAHGKFDDAKWDVVAPDTLKNGRGRGKFSLAWYRIKVTIPDKVGDVDVTGSEVWFRTTVDDYGEVWVNGALDNSFGKSGRGAVSGFNTPNQVVISKSAKPGEEIQIAVLGMNGPFGNPPANKIFLRNAEIRFFKK